MSLTALYFLIINGCVQFHNKSQILKQNYNNYENALIILILEKLSRTLELRGTLELELTNLMQTLSFRLQYL